MSHSLCLDASEGTCTPTQHAKIPGYLKYIAWNTFPMDAEQINQIGTALTSLTARTLDLRGYL
jgi:hypothetical protein